MMPWKQRQCIVSDDTCHDALAPSHLNRAVTGAGAVATIAEHNERLKYAEITWTHIFTSIAFETLRAVGEKGKTFLKELLGRVCRTVTEERRSLELMMQRFSVAIQRGNADCIVETLPTT